MKFGCNKIGKNIITILAIDEEGKRTEKTVEVYYWDVNDNVAIQEYCNASDKIIGYGMENESFFSNLISSNLFQGEVVKLGKDSNIFINMMNRKDSYSQIINELIDKDWTKELNTISYWLNKKCWLYKNGDECEDITGGIVCSKVNGDYSRNGDNIFLTWNGNNSFARAKVSTQNKINTTGYTYIKAYANVTNYSSAYWHHIGLFTINNFNDKYPGFYKTVEWESGTGMRTLSCAINEQSDNYYPGIFIDYLNALYIYQIWLE